MYDRSPSRASARQISALLGVWGVLAATIAAMVLMVAAGTRLGLDREHAVGIAAIAAFAAAIGASAVTRRRD